MVERLLSLPLEYWNQFMMVDQENIDSQRGNGNSTPRTPDVKGQFCPASVLPQELGWVHFPELQLDRLRWGGDEHL